MKKAVIVFIKVGEELTLEQVHLLNITFGANAWYYHYIIDVYQMSEKSLRELAEQTQANDTVHACNIPLLLLLTNNKQNGCKNYVLHNDDALPFVCNGHIPLYHDPITCYDKDYDCLEVSIDLFFKILQYRFKNELNGTYYSQVSNANIYVSEPSGFFRTTELCFDVNIQENTWKTFYVNDIVSVYPPIANYQSKWKLIS